jgi:hypothetical protein
MATKTAMMEHIKWLNEVINIAQAQQMNADIIQAIEYIIEGAKAKLQMEKEQIKNAWVNAWQESFIKPLDYQFYEPEAEQYYNETYNQ